jgi:molecular chaperone HtpG
MQDARKDEFFTLEEYRNAAAALQTNKEDKLVILYTTDPVQQDAYVRAAEDRGFRVVKLDSLVDASFIQHMEMKWEKVHFARVDADIADNLIDKQESAASVLGTDDQDKLKSLFQVPAEGLHVTVDVRGLSADTPPVTATRPEFMRRMKDMAAASGPMGSFYANMPDEVTLTVNGNHRVFAGLLAEADADRQQKLARNLADLALLSQGLLKGAALTDFVRRSVEMMQPAEASASSTTA